MELPFRSESYVTSENVHPNCRLAITNSVLDGCFGDYALVELVQNPIFRLLQVSPVLNARTKQLGTDVTSGLFARTLYDNWMIG